VRHLGREAKLTAFSLSVDVAPVGLGLSWSGAIVTRPSGAAAVVPAGRRVLAASYWGTFVTVPTDGRSCDRSMMLVGAR
jgi:hypothetical protein